MSNIILFGFKGSGKSYWGKLLAEHLGRKFIDTDDYLEKSVYRECGEAVFREKEREVIVSLKDVRDAVIALGGGAILCPQNLALLSKMGTLIYLEEDKELLQERVGSIYLGEQFEVVYARRKPMYESIVAKRALMKGKTVQYLKEIIDGKQ